MAECAGFEPIDILFAKRILHPYPCASEAAHLFLAKLMAAARRGHLCIAHEKGAEELPKELLDEIVCREESRWYLKRSWDAEQLFLSHWKRLSKSIPKEISLEEESFDNLPRGLVQKVLKRSVTLLCGGPGTGKSTAACHLVRLLARYMKGGIALAAPTGKATANLRAGGEKASIQTLHALLQKRRALPFDLIVVDEASMIDAEMMGRLFSAVKEGGRLLLIGDKDQLPPVESGHLFADLAAAYPDTLFELKTCFRTDLQEIISLAAAVKRGEKIPISPLPDVKTVVEMITNKRPWEPCSRFCALSPIREGPYGVNTLNTLLYREQIKRGLFSIPILITANDHKLVLFNGDIGRLDEKSNMALFAEDKKLPAALLPPYEYGYVLSVHKSQGSEYDEVLILLPEGAENFGREMLYTAITRARKRVSLLGSEEILEQVLSRQTRRLSGIHIEIQELGILPIPAPQI